MIFECHWSHAHTVKLFQLVCHQDKKRQIKKTIWKLVSTVCVQLTSSLSYALTLEHAGSHTYYLSYLIHIYVCYILPLTVFLVSILYQVLFTIAVNFFHRELKLVKDGNVFTLNKRKCGLDVLSSLSHTLIQSLNSFPRRTLS